MDGHRFDGFVKALAAPGSRRAALGVALGGALSVALGSRALARRRYSEREIIRIIEQAADRYNQPKRAMVRVARCESNLDPYAVNRAGPYYGLYQFLKSTWRTTPYRDEDIFDPRANARAAAWMWKQGRRNEWACQ
ncbi:MAG: transglycosylase SLT domain-containing protein [Chloroflexota bacterium]|nr:transglycosylase SLT domain-containing protein [Chloroflexota bacterium]